MSHLEYRPGVLRGQAIAGSVNASRERFGWPFCPQSEAGVRFAAAGLQHDERHVTARRQGAQRLPARRPQSGRDPSRALAYIGEGGILELQGDRWTVTQDYASSSAFTAADVLAGRNANGRRDWRDKAGRGLKAIQAELVAVDDG